MTPQAAWEFTKQLSPLPGPGGAPSELEQAAQGKYADMGLPEIYPVAQIKENQQISVKVEAAKAKMAAEQQAQEQGLPHPPQAPILEQLLAQERQRKGEPPMPQGQMPPQGMPQQGMPQQGMPPQGMPPQGIPGQAYGGLVGLQDGGLFSGAQGYATKVSVDPDSSNAVQEDEDDPGNLFGRIAFGAGSWEEAREHPWKTGAHTLLTAASLFPATAAVGWGVKGLKGGIGALRGIQKSGPLLESLGKGALGMAEKGGWRGLVARGLLGKRRTGFDPSKITNRTWRVGRESGSGFLGYGELGRTAALRGLGGAGLLGLGTVASWGEPDDMTDEEREAAAKALLAQFPDVNGDGPSPRGKGDGVEGMTAADRGKFNAMRTQVEEHEKWLRGETPEEEAERLFNATRAEAMEGRIDPERNSRERKGMLYDILAQGLLAAPDSAGPGSMGRAMSKYGGVGGIRSLMGLSREQEARDQALEDVAAEYRSRNLGAASERTRQSMFEEELGISGAEMDYDLEMRRINATLLASARQLRASQALNPSDLEKILGMAWRRAITDPNFDKLNQEQTTEVVWAIVQDLLGQRSAGLSADVE